MGNQKIAIIGCGNLGLAILNGLLANENYNAEDIIATKRNLSTLDHLDLGSVELTSDNEYAVQKSNMLILGLKPYNILDVLDDIRSELDSQQHTVVSLATGITLAEMKNVIGSDIPIYRAMPNTAADVGESMTCICGNSNTNFEDVQSIFNSIGKSIKIDESLMESATVLGACGIAYVLRFIRGMIQGGIQIGFDARTANEIVNQTVKGAAELLLQRGNHPEHEIDKVTTPRGCTIQGLNEMEHHGFSSALIKGINSSFQMIEKR